MRKIHHENVRQHAAAHPGMVAYVLDVDDARAIGDFAASVTANHPDLTVLLNNAGVMKAEDLTAETVDVSIAETTITTNLLAPIRLTAALLPHLRRWPRSTIINVSSGLAFVSPRDDADLQRNKGRYSFVHHRAVPPVAGTSVEVTKLIPSSVQTDLILGPCKRIPMPCRWPSSSPRR
jgi:uncharacterized oxidoreductase